jgi:subtilisin family serine protease
MVREAKSAADIAQFRADAAATGEVLAFAADGEVHSLGQTEAWGFTDDGFRNAWSGATQGDGVRVAVLDTGIDATLGDFQGRLDPLPGVDMLTHCTDATNTLVPTPGVTTDPNGHGTHVSGIIAADDDTNGVVGGAPGATLVPVRVLDASGSGKFSNVAAGILWAADKTKGNASVISMSLGGLYDGGVVAAAIASVEDPTNDVYTHPVIVVAAGNGNGGPTEYPAAYGSVNSYGTVFPQVLPVAALCKPGFPSASGGADQCSSGSTIASFSSHPWNGSLPATGVSAPGTSIVSDWPTSLLPAGTKTLSGTSMATPLVAALAALATAQDCPGETAAHVVARIEAGSTDLGTPGADTTFGYGAINPAKTLSSC